MRRVARLVGPLADMSRNLFKTEQLVESHFWALLKLDCGMLGHDRKVEEEDHIRAERSMCPYDFDDYQQNGWIAEYLELLQFSHNGSRRFSMKYFSFFAFYKI